MSSRYADNDLLSLGLVADILSVSKETVRKWNFSGKLVESGKQLDGAPAFYWRDLQQFKQMRKINDTEWSKEAAVKPLRPYRAVELFAGGGGLALGLELAGFESILLNEIDRDACDTLRRNRANWNVVEADVASLDLSSIPDIDLVSGGFPCQAFSYAGQRLGFEDTRGTLFFEFARVIKETKPKIFLGENVRGLLTHDGGKTIKAIKHVIEEIGYTLVEPHVLKAIFYKVPQKRERLALVGIRNDLADCLRAFRWPSPAPRVYTMRDALRKGDLFDSDVPLSDGAAYPEWRRKIMALIPQGGYWKDLPLPLQRKLLKGSFHLDGGKTGIGRRLSWEEPSLTLTCAPAQNQTGRCHPEENRPLTVREYARVQTFPDDWIFSGSLASQYRQIGNAVPVNLAEALGRRLVALLNEVERFETDNQSRVSVKSESPAPVIIRAQRPVQLSLFEPSTMYLVAASPLTLLGTYRKTCLPWILSQNLYNYPITDAELANIPELLSMERLILVRQKDNPLFFNVKGCSIVAKQQLDELGYQTGKRHPASQQYILYSLRAASEWDVDLESAVPIVGKGVSKKCVHVNSALTEK